MRPWSSFYYIFWDIPPLLLIYTSPFFALFLCLLANQRKKSVPCTSESHETQVADKWFANGSSSATGREHAPQGKDRTGPGKCCIGKGPPPVARKVHQCPETTGESPAAEASCQCSEKATKGYPRAHLTWPARPVGSASKQASPILIPLEHSHSPESCLMTCKILYSCGLLIHIIDHW